MEDIVYTRFAEVALCFELFDFDGVPLNIRSLSNVQAHIVPAARRFNRGAFSLQQLSRDGRQLSAVYDYTQPRYFGLNYVIVSCDAPGGGKFEFIADNYLVFSNAATPSGTRPRVERLQLYRVKTRRYE